MPFQKLTIEDFRQFIQLQSPNRSISRLQVHHTWKPDHSNFDGDNHLSITQGMHRYHTGTKGWSDIAYHFLLFPDGGIVTGRPITEIPAGIAGKNMGSIAVALIGNFDNGADTMASEQKAACIELFALLCKRFRLLPSGETIIYHHWYSQKSCPGTNFFTGNSRASARMAFFPHILEAMKGTGHIEPQPEAEDIATIVNDATGYFHDKTEQAFAKLAFWKEGTGGADSRQISKTEKTGIVAFLAFCLFALARLTKTIGA